MAIVGVGIDTVEVPRIERAIARNGEAFIKRIAHPVELKNQPNAMGRRAEYWAARFATKEAFAKAMGTGIGKVVELSAVGIKKDKSGKPELTFSTKLKATLKRRGISRTHVSISHTATSAVAVVILEGK